MGWWGEPSGYGALTPSAGFRRPPATWAATPGVASGTPPRAKPEEAAETPAYVCVCRLVATCPEEAKRFWRKPDNGGM